MDPLTVILGMHHAEEARLWVENERLRVELADAHAEISRLRSMTPMVMMRAKWKAIGAEYPGAPGGFKRAVRQAIMRGKEWDLSPVEWLHFTARPCEDCGGPVGNGIGLDRVDNAKGYEVGNVRPCCGPCNIARGRKRLGHHEP